MRAWGSRKICPTYLIVHIVLALSLVPLLLLKIVIARFYKQNHSSLMVLGMTIFVVAFVLVSIPTFSELLRSASPGTLGLKVATGLFISACLVQCLLICAQTENQRVRIVQKGLTSEHSTTAIALPNQQSTETSMTLLLAQIEQQTHDTRTLGQKSAWGQ